MGETSPMYVQLLAVPELRVAAPAPRPRWALGHQTGFFVGILGLRADNPVGDQPMLGRSRSRELFSRLVFSLRQRESPFLSTKRDGCSSLILANFLAVWWLSEASM